MKKLGAAALTLALAGAMTVPAFAAEDLLISPNPNAYATSITLNGETLDTTGVPAASRADLLPMRLVAEADTAPPTGTRRTTRAGSTLAETRSPSSLRPTPSWSTTWR